MVWKIILKYPITINFEKNWTKSATSWCTNYSVKIVLLFVATSLMYEIWNICLHIVIHRYVFIHSYVSTHRYVSRHSYVFESKILYCLKLFVWMLFSAFFLKLPPPQFDFVNLFFGNYYWFFWKKFREKKLVSKNFI